jgi:8-oxo-dGTP diphosphatase
LCVKKAAMSAFRHLPAPVRRLAVHAGAPSFTVGAVAVLRRGDGRLLLVEQRHSPGWALPGGLLRRGESPAEAVVREIREEVGLRLDLATLPVPMAAVNARVRRVDIVFLVDADGDADPWAADEAEVKRIGWYPLDGLPEMGEPTLDILAAIRLR